MNINTPTGTGTCYEDAWRYLILHEEGRLVHGSIKVSEEGKSIKHAWVELPYGWVWEPQTGQYFTNDNFSMLFDPIVDESFNAEEAAIMLARVGKHGPWLTEEKTQYIGGSK